MDIGGKDRTRLYAADTANRGGVNVEGFHGDNSQQQHHHHHQLPAEAFYRVFQYPPQHQQFVQPMTVFNNEGFVPPPPGLSQPPPGFYYPPSAAQQANLFYASPSSSSGQNQHPTMMPVHHPQQQQHQQVYGQFQFQAASGPNIAAECPLRLSPELLLDRGDAQMNVIENGLPSVKKQPVIDPMIENIVGSMSMSTNGTYTPFGPSVSIASTVVGGSHLGGFSQHPLGTNEITENHMRSGPLLSTVVAGSVGSRDKIGIVKPRVIGKEAVGNEKVVQRAATPKEGTDSRPQTPGKLSYSEVLTKNEPKGSVSSSKVSASNSPSPALGCRTAEGTPGGSRRISVTNLQHSDSKDAFHSNSSSSSSSPVTKPKLPSNSSSSFETVATKGCRNKENNNNNNSSSSSSSNSSKSSQRNTPSATPTHSVGTPVAGQKSGKSDRKVLNISNSQSGGGLGKSKTGAAGKAAKNFPFEFDIEDLDEFQERLGSDGKSSVTKRDSLSGGSSVSSSSKNATSAGSCHSNNVGAEKKTAVLQNGKGRVGREKAERQRSRKGGRDGCIVRRVQLLTAVWALHLISALNWLYRLVLDVGTLSCSLAFTLLEDGYNWWKANAFPSCCQHLRGYMTKIFNLWTRLKSWKLGYLWRRGKGDGVGGDEKNSDGKFGAGGAGMRGGGKNGLSEILSMMGPDRNITLPVNGDEALKRLMSVKGQDPYSILGIRSDSSDETIRRYYKRQAVLVHPDKNIVPGAEEAFKILARAFELIGEPAKRMEYHRQLLEAHQKEVVFGEIGNLLEQLRKKIESVSNSIRCTKCNSRHKKNKTDRPLFAARYCAQCRINHGAREGDLWAERKGLFGWSRSYYACMESSIWEVNEWASCQKKNLKHLLPDCHNVMYRLVAGGAGAGGGGGNATTSSSNLPGSTTNNASSNSSNANNTCGNCCNPGQAGHNNKSGKVPSNSSSHGNGWDEFGGSSRSEETAEPGMDDWDTLISNLVRNPSGPGTSHHHHHSKNTHVNSSSSSASSFSGSKFSGLGSGASATTGSGGGGVGCPSANVNPSRRRGKVKRK